MEQRKVTNAVLIHHSDSDRNNTTAAQIKKWHLAKGWSDIGYHYVIRGDGTLEIGRQENLKGAHCPDWNWRSVGVCCTGSFVKGKDVMLVTDPQYKALTQIVADICKRYKIKPTEIYGHCECFATECPGQIQQLKPNIERDVDLLMRNVVL